MDISLDKVAHNTSVCQNFHDDDDGNLWRGTDDRLAPKMIRWERRTRSPPCSFVFGASTIKTDAASRVVLIVVVVFP